MSSEKKRLPGFDSRIHVPDPDDPEIIRLMEEAMADGSIESLLDEGDACESVDVEALIEEALTSLDAEDLMLSDFAGALRKIEEVDRERARSEPRKAPEIKAHRSGDAHFYWFRPRGRKHRLLTFDVHHRGDGPNLTAKNTDIWFDRLHDFATIAGQQRVMIVHGGKHGTAWRDAMWRYFGRSCCEYAYQDTVSIVNLETR